ncbi:MAG: hypothetical protein EXS37_20210 [Opitutus sp.]|nr:hypothetical protein [Opitutus sp.]
MTRKLQDLLHREAHLKLWRTQLRPLWAEKEAALRAVQAARPTFIGLFSTSRRDDYNRRLGAAQATADNLRMRGELLDLCEPHIAKMIEQEVEVSLCEECTEYIQALAAHRQKEDWLRCLERFGENILEFTRALGNVRNLASSGYARHTQTYSGGALQAFGLAFTAAQMVEEAVTFANNISDTQLEVLRASGVDTRALPRLPETSFSEWVDKIKRLPPPEAQIQFGALIESTKQLHAAGIPELRTQADLVEQAQVVDLKNFLKSFWAQFRAEVAPEIFPGDTDRSVRETEQMLQAVARTSVVGRK